MWVQFRVGCFVENWVLMLDVSLQCRNRISSVSGLTGCELQGRNLIPIRDIGFFLFTTPRRTRAEAFYPFEYPLGQFPLRVKCLEIEDDHSHLASDKDENLSKSAYFPHCNYYCLVFIIVD